MVIGGENQPECGFVLSVPTHPTVPICRIIEISRPIHTPRVLPPHVPMSPTLCPCPAAQLCVHGVAVDVSELVGGCFILLHLFYHRIGRVGSRKTISTDLQQETAMTSRLIPMASCPMGPGGARPRGCSVLWIWKGRPCRAPGCPRRGSRRDSASCTAGRWVRVPHSPAVGPVGSRSCHPFQSSSLLS